MGFSSTGSTLRLGELGTDGAGVGCIISFADNLMCYLYFFTPSLRLCSEGIGFN